MANLYMGRGGIDGLFGGRNGGGSVGPIVSGPYQGGSPSRPMPLPPRGKGSVGPIISGPFTEGETPPSSGNPASLGAQAIRPTGPSQGFDPSYLQNLATSIGALFARPQGNLNFNPLGNLSEISPPSGQMGNAPGFGEPLTWLQQALNGLAFMFKPPVAPDTGGGGAGDASGINNGGRRGREPLWFLNQQ